MTEFNWILRGRCYLLGDDVPHADGVIPQQFIIDRETDPEVLAPHLFELTDPEFVKRCKSGDIVVAGRNFGVGQKSTGYIAMQALGLGLLCESMPTQGYRGAIHSGLRLLANCPGVTSVCNNGDEIEVNFATGSVINHTQSKSHHYSPIPINLQKIIAAGGGEAWLKNWALENSNSSSNKA
jgi:3-isopropylmalate/(R)-2-methylmalate dehydratase small subunit